MGFREYIGNIKKKAYDYRENKEQQNAIREANKLKALRERRIKAEGRAKIYTNKEREEKKLKKANEKVRKNKPLYKLTQEIKKRRKKKSGFGRLPGQLGGGL